MTSNKDRNERIVWIYTLRTVPKSFILHCCDTRPFEEYRIEFCGSVKQILVKMKEPHVLELLWQNPLSYEHILQQIFLYLDSSTIRNLKCSNSEMRNYVQRLLWQNSKAQRCLTNKLKNRYDFCFYTYF